MAEYTEVMKQQKRMCKYYEKISDSCDGCPIHEEEIAYICCEAPCAIDIKDVDKAEKLIMAWAAEHPEPVYPTWTEYFRMIGVFPSWSGHEILDATHIPPETAKKLGVEPKEG